MADPAAPDSTTSNASSAAAAVAVSATTPPVVTPVPKRAWGDEEDDDVGDVGDSSSAPSEYMESLKIQDEKTLEEPEDSNITAVTTGDTPYSSASTFEDLNLSPEILKGLYVEMKFQKPSKIQAISLPMILTPPYKDLIAQAHNGSGKTTCFVLGMLSRVDVNLKAPQAFCICPTRELAMQNIEVLKKMGKYTGITSECAVPADSANYVPMSKRPPITAQVVIGTPGTIKKWMSSRKLGVSCVKILVFDEADHMLSEDGFRDDSLRIMRDIEKSSPHCQVLLFSATFDETVKNFVSRVVKDYNQLFVKKEELSLEGVKQYKVICPDELAKIRIIKDRIFELGEKLGQTIIFVRTRNSASMLHKALVDYGYDVTTIQGALTTEDRDKIIKEFKDGLTKVLISTDLLSRGFDQQQVNLVINYDLPLKYESSSEAMKFRSSSQSEPNYEVYLHRIGRAGRFGRKGAVFNLLCGDVEIMRMDKIQNHFNSEVTEVRDSDEDIQAALRTAGLL
ncbi:DEAD-box ATP-dependent RNA helicase 38 [Cucurbita argyrosperma subsp. argyrosperma]|uniref:RNA helicase n=1 Tax=Cucurbita moschata TaxID=3662 RepID=A0A6J1F4Z0_CUCMO|nr:DEAD-box ATP-dependent RNA helicase 38 [Cucurbita moschata]KAG7017403.1 DEAD-box ATP-dependent RNA helicase 38 [Cucurbita argyrosperma subsp. argyrosperma]